MTDRTLDSKKPLDLCYVKHQTLFWRAAMNKLVDRLKRTMNSDKEYIIKSFLAKVPLIR